MGLVRSTFYDPAPATLDAGEVVTRIGAICDEFECYSYRRVGPALRHQGIVVNGKKLGVVQIRVTRETWTPLNHVQFEIHSRGTWLGDGRFPYDCFPERPR